jgi:hypothetical protein
LYWRPTESNAWRRVHASRREAIEIPDFYPPKKSKILSKKFKKLLHYFFLCNILKKLANKTAVKAGRQSAIRMNDGASILGGAKVEKCAKT